MFWSFVTHMDLFVKGIVIFLILLSIWSWGLFLEKLALLKIKISLSKAFEREFYSGEMLDQIYNRLSNKKNIHSPLAKVFFVGMRELNLSNVRNLNFSSTNTEYIKRNIKERIISLTNVERTKIVNSIKKGIPTLASIGSLTPFIGLLGTVWGIMNTFQALATAKTVSLQAVLPGIAEALFATIIGLLVAIPAVFFYNFLTAKINGFIATSEVFSIELANILSRELDSMTTNALQQQQDGAPGLPR